MENWNPYRDEEYTKKHYGVKSQAQLIAAIIVFSCLILGAVILLGSCLVEIIIK